MEKINYEQELINACNYAGIDLTDKMLSQFDEYFNLLIEWNKNVNLTAITERADVYVKHFADSVYGAKFIKQNASLCDIGTGAGFPALVIKIVRPDIKVTLVDALDKRIKFLNEVISKLGLTDVNCLHCRAEDKIFKQKYLNSFDVTTARAVARMTTLTEYCLPFVKVGGKFIAYKSDKIDDELNESKKAIVLLGGEIGEKAKYQLDQQTTRLLVIVNKKALTDPKYPRDKNKPKLHPIL